MKNKIVVSDTQAYRQFGNAVVPKVVEAVGRQIMKVMFWKLSQEESLFRKAPMKTEELARELHRIASERSKTACAHGNALLKFISPNDAGLTRQPPVRLLYAGFCLGDVHATSPQGRAKRQTRRPIFWHFVAGRSNHRIDDHVVRGGQT